MSQTDIKLDVNLNVKSVDNMTQTSDAVYVNKAFMNDESLESLELKAGTLGHLRGTGSVLTLPQMQKKPGLMRRGSSHTSSLVAQKFTEPAKKAAAKFSSVNYNPTHSLAYMDWLRSYDNHAGYQWDRWILTLLIGIVTGLVAIFLNQSLGALGTVKWSRAQEYAQNLEYLLSWGWTFGISCVFALIASLLVTFVHPPAAGGGTPDVIAYLNGVVVHGAFGMKNFLVKFASILFAVSSGMPCGIQGPLITFGAVVGMGIGQFRSETLKCKPSAFSRFRNAMDRRWFTTAGVAAGVAAGFNAPVGGLMFAMEDISSFWSKDLSWHVFFCSVVATAVAGLFEAALNGFKFQGVFGLFTLSVTEPITPHIALLCAAVVLGLVGGILGAVFTLCNTQVVGVARKLVLSKPKKPTGMKILRVLECIIIVFIMSFYYTALPEAFECKNLRDINSNVSTSVADCLGLGGSTTYGDYKSPIKLIPYHCQNSDNETDNFYYSEIATIVQNGGQAQLSLLWSRGTHHYFTWHALLILLAVLFPMAIWTLGSGIAGGIFVPVLLSGSLYGRALGIGMVHLYTYISGIDIPVDPTWRWIDPGMIAVMGAGSLLGGVTRLALATTVIVVEMSQDINMIIPVMITILVAKWTADNICKPLYKFQLDGKSLPYLDQDPIIALEGSMVKLELFKAKDVMACPVRTIRAVESLHTLSRLLIDTSHDAFPVVKRDQETKLDVCYGMITRMELYTILCSREVCDENSANVIIIPNVMYDELSQDYMTDEKAKVERVKSFCKLEHYESVFVNLDQFINISTTKVEGDFSLRRTYSLFRTLGLRHLVVVNIRNEPIGMITRVDLMPFNIVDKLSTLPTESKDPSRGMVRQTSVVSLNSNKGPALLPAVKVGLPSMGTPNVGIPNMASPNMGFSIGDIPTVSQKVDTIEEEEGRSTRSKSSASSGDFGGIPIGVDDVDIPL